MAGSVTVKEQFHARKLQELFTFVSYPLSCLKRPAQLVTSLPPASRTTNYKLTAGCKKTVFHTFILFQVKKKVLLSVEHNPRSVNLLRSIYNVTLLEARNSGRRRSYCTKGPHSFQDLAAQKTFNVTSSLHHNLSLTSKTQRT